MRAALRALAALLIGAGLGCAAEGEPAPGALPRAKLSVGMHVVEVEVADTLERRTRGLSGRASLADGHGMVFPYARAGRHGFWMADMHFDIDIVWIRDGRIVDVTHGAVHDPPGELPVYRPREPADLVLEVPAGTAARLGWRAGDPVRVEPPLAAPGPEARGGDRPGYGSRARSRPARAALAREPRPAPTRPSVGSGRFRTAPA